MDFRFQFYKTMKFLYRNLQNSVEDNQSFFAFFFSLNKITNKFFIKPDKSPSNIFEYQIKDYSKEIHKI